MTDFGTDWINSWKKTDNYRIFDKFTGSDGWFYYIDGRWYVLIDPNLFDIVEPRHPCAGGISIEDFQRRVAQWVLQRLSTFTSIDMLAAKWRNFTWTNASTLVAKSSEKDWQSGKRKFPTHSQPYGQILRWCAKHSARKMKQNPHLLPSIQEHRSKPHPRERALTSHLGGLGHLRSVRQAGVVHQRRMFLLHEQTTFEIKRVDLLAIWWVHLCVGCATDSVVFDALFKRFGRYLTSLTVS